MPISTILRRASSYILGYDSDSDLQNSQQCQYEDNEILFCKNNVCVHPPATVRQDYDIIHHPGYLTITTKTFIDQYNDAKRPTLFLNWIPNSTLRKCPTTLENSTSNSLKQNGYERSTDILKQNGFDKNYFDESKLKYLRHNSTESLISSVSDTPKMNTNPFLTDDVSISQKSDEIFQDDAPNIKKNDEIVSNISDYDGEVSLSSNESKDENNEMRININVEIANPNIEIITTPDSVKDVTESYENSKNMFTFSRSESIISCDDQPWLSTPELLALKHNLYFPDSTTASPIICYATKREHKCRRFSVDLSQMRSLRLFFSDSSCTCGQLVVASRESQYKILHFHHGGLDHLAQVLHQWHSLLHSIKLTKGADDNLPYRHFMVCRPEVTVQELHPEEGQVPKLTTNAFRALLNERGQLEDDLALRRSVFFGGIERGLRSTVWPFLLHVYPYQSTYEERLHISEIRKQEYEEITRRRLHEMSAEEQEKFFRTIQCVVEKDVIRTDRANPFFAGEGNPNVETMKNVLLNYAFYNPGLGYTQGMSDLLAPVLCEIGDEAATFWCFVGLMQRAVFVATPTDNDMERNLNYLRELIRIMVPHFFAHLQKHEDAMELLFCHRWILLCFKREFTEAVALQMWEACWANYLTDYFHLFLCLAIICVYADDVIAQDLRADEMLLHFSSLAMYMEGHVIIRKARGLLHQYRQLARIPCTLRDLCTRCGPGQWDSSHSPVIECISDSECSCRNSDGEVD